MCEERENTTGNKQDQTNNQRPIKQTSLDLPINPLAMESDLNILNAFLEN